MKEEMKMLVGERLAELRKDMGKTQKQIAADLHVNYRTYSSYERGETEPGDDVKIAIAKYFNVSLDYLLGIIDRPRPLNEDNRYIRLPHPLSVSAYNDLMKYMQYLLKGN